MALRGNLRDFSLPDVFQLVQLSGKTGVLRISGRDAEGSIWFRDGEVFFAQSNWRREQLGERLVAAQRITPAALARALELRSAEPEGGRRLGEILVNEGYITPQVLETFVQEQIQDTIFDLMRWDEGDFDFEVLPDVVHEDIGLSVSVENIVMEGSRRLEEWQRIKKKVPSTEMVFKMATAPGEGTFEISLKPVEWALLLLIDGTRSVRELAVETHSTDFDVARVIYGLFSAGLLEVPGDEEIERLRADRARREDKRAKLEAVRAAREQEQMVEALDLEAQLTASAEARRQTASPETSAAVMPVAEEPPAAASASVATQEAEESAEEAIPKHVPEEPEFLAGSAEPASVEDMAVFEQMMASVLSPQGPGEAEPEETPAGERQPEPESEPESGPEAQLPVDLEAMLAAELAPEVAETPDVPQASELPDEFVPGIDFMAEAPSASIPARSAGYQDEAGEETGLGAEAPFIAFAPELALEPDQDQGEPQQAPAPAGVDLSVLTIAELEALSATPASQGPATTGDYEADLRSLGLGEYPEELLQARAAEGDLLQPAGAEAYSEPGTAAPDETPEYEPTTERRLPMSEIDTGVESGPPSAPASELEQAADEDLDSLLASLEGQADGAAGVIASETDFAGETGTSGGYISTDAFLAEFDDSGLSNGLGDELTALTGGGVVGRNRPVATVARLPEAGEGHVLHRDQMVDRSLLEKIIEGIENL